MGVAKGRGDCCGLDVTAGAALGFLAAAPLDGSGRRGTEASRVRCRTSSPPARNTLSTQEAFGRILGESPPPASAAETHPWTTSPDVTVADQSRTVGQPPRDLRPREQPDKFRDEKVVRRSAGRLRRGVRTASRIAESNLFLRSPRGSRRSRSSARGAADRQPLPIHSSSAASMY